MYKNARTLPRGGFQPRNAGPSSLSDGPTPTQRIALDRYNARIENERYLFARKPRKDGSQDQARRTILPDTVSEA
jgi:hypothetical protein